MHTRLQVGIFESGHIELSNINIRQNRVEWKQENMTALQFQLWSYIWMWTIFRGLYHMLQSIMQEIQINVQMIFFCFVLLWLYLCIHIGMQYTQMIWVNQLLPNHIKTQQRCNHAHTS